MMKQLRKLSTTSRFSYPPYGGAHDSKNFKITHTVSEFRNQYNSILKPGDQKTDSKEISIAGRVISKREASKKLYFIDIENNGTRVQIMSNEKHFIESIPSLSSTPTTSTIDHSNSFSSSGSFNTFRSSHRELQRGDIIGITGFPAKSKIGELSLVPTAMHWLAPCLHDLPAPGDPPPTDPNTRFRKRAADLISNTTARNVLKSRFAIISLLRQYLESKDFIEAETPILNINAGGAVARPFTTSSIALGSTAPPLNLRIAPELYLKQLVIGGFDRVFEIGKVFRNEGIDSTHNPEFTTCEFYQTYSDYTDLMTMTEEMLSTIEINLQKQGIGKNQDKNKNKDKNKAKAKDKDKDKTNSLLFQNIPYKRISVYDELEKRLKCKLPNPAELENEHSISILIDICETNDIPLQINSDLSVPKILDTMIGHLIEPLCIEPTFLCDHPIIMSPLAKNHRTKPGLTERFELFINGSELCNAYSELNDPTEQRKRFQQQATLAQMHPGDVEIPKKDEEFCNALEYGLPPTAGWGIGIDRLVMLLTNTKHIREVLPFVLVKPNEDA